MQILREEETAFLQFSEWDLEAVLIGMAELPHSDIPNLSIRDKLDAALLIDQGCPNH